MMPGMTAADFINALLEIDRHLPRIVMMTAAEEAFQRAQSIGASEVLRKPFDANLLFDLIEPCVV